MAVSTDQYAVKWSEPGSRPGPQELQTLRKLRRQAVQVAPVLAKIARHVATVAGGDVYIKEGAADAYAAGADLKAVRRSKEKVRTEIGSYDQLTDVLRISIVCPTLASAYAGARALVEHCGKAVECIKDRFETPQKSGYSDIIAHIRMPNGHVAEVQIHVRPMFIAKEIEHALYRERRLIESGAQPDEHGRHALLQGAATAIYSMARFAVEDGRDLNEEDLYFMRSFLPDPS